MTFSGMTSYPYDVVVSKWIFNNDRVYSNFSKMRGYVMGLITQEKNTKIADLLILPDKKPEFETGEKALKFDSYGYLLGAKLKNSLNKSQIQVLDQTLNAKDYSLIVGMPGTGKTFTTCLLLKILIERKKRVLVTSYTHQSIDNIIEKFLKLFPKDKHHLARMSSSKSASSQMDINDLIFDNKQFKNFTDIDNYLDQRRVMFTTCLSTRMPILNARAFDFVIVDEASLTVEPIMLGSLFFSEKFVMIGDYFQLSPIVQSKDAGQLGLQTSLFERLCIAHPEAVTYLDVQYRMNEDIVKLCNNLVYNNKLKTDPDVLTQKMVFSGFNYDNEETLWVKDLISTKNSVVFVDIDSFKSFIEANPLIQGLLKESQEYMKDLEISLSPSFENS